MKPTDEERRAVAKRLRNNADQNRRWVVPWAVFNDADEHGDIELNNRLADLIEPEPERTCRDDGNFVFRCSACGAFIKRGSVTDCYGTIPIRFCPNCSAKVVER